MVNQSLRKPTDGLLIRGRQAFPAQEGIGCPIDPRYPISGQGHLRYTFSRAEVAMGLPEFRQEFEAFKKTLPDPKMVARHPDGDGLPDPDRALDHTETMFYRWWASMVGAADQYRLLVQQQEDEALCFGLDVGVGYILAQIDWVIGFLEGLPPMPNWNEPDLAIAQRVELRDFATRYSASIQRCLSRARRLRESVQSITRDYGPEARGGSESASAKCASMARPAGTVPAME